MAISKAQLRTLRLLDCAPAHRFYRSQRAGDYTWVHEQATVPITVTLHQLFVSGHARLQPGNKDVAILTEKGRSVLKGWGEELEGS
jgi:hypothetical protein